MLNVAGVVHTVIILQVDSQVHEKLNTVTEYIYDFYWKGQHKPYTKIWQHEIQAMQVSNDE